MKASAIKVLMLNYEYPPLGGGAANANYYLIKEFSNFADLDIELVTSHNNIKSTVEKFAENIKIHFLPVKKKQLHYWTQKEVLSYSWQAFSYLKGLVNREKFDLCHCFFALPCGWLASRFQSSFFFFFYFRGSVVPGFYQRIKIY
jgi:hypothetical protein